MERTWELESSKQGIWTLLLRNCMQLRMPINCSEQYFSLLNKWRWDNLLVWVAVRVHNIYLLSAICPSIYIDAQCLHFLTCKTGIVSVLLMRLFWERNVWLHVKQAEGCLVQGKHPGNVRGQGCCYTWSTYSIPLGGVPKYDKTVSPIKETINDFIPNCVTQTKITF